MEISKTKIENRIRKKSNPELIRTLLILKRSNPEIAKILAMPRRKMTKINLDELSEQCKDNEKVLIVGKILGNGSLDKKLKIVAVSASQEALVKIKAAKSEFVALKDEMKTGKLNELRLIR
jgi:large subunit ribosomal protein L18e